MPRVDYIGDIIIYYSGTNYINMGYIISIDSAVVPRHL
jgi:hypothetical protein